MERRATALADAVAGLAATARASLASGAHGSNHHARHASREVVGVLDTTDVISFFAQGHRIGDSGRTTEDEDEAAMEAGGGLQMATNPLQQPIQLQLPTVSEDEEQAKEVPVPVPSLAVVSASASASL